MDIPPLVAPAQLNLIFGRCTFDNSALFFLIMAWCHVPSPKIEFTEIICELSRTCKFTSCACVCPGSLPQPVLRSKFRYKFTPEEFGGGGSSQHSAAVIPIVDISAQHCSLGGSRGIYCNTSVAEHINISVGRQLPFVARKPCIRQSGSMI